MPHRLCVTRATLVYNLSGCLRSLFRGRARLLLVRIFFLGQWSRSMCFEWRYLEWKHAPCSLYYMLYSLQKMDINLFIQSIKDLGDQSGFYFAVACVLITTGMYMAWLWLVTLFRVYTCILNICANEMGFYSLRHHLRKALCPPRELPFDSVIPWWY